MKREQGEVEKRRCSRLEAEIPVICRVLDSDHVGQEIKAKSSNISKKGVLLIWPKHIPGFERTLTYLEKGRERRMSFAPQDGGRRKRFSRLKVELKSNGSKIKTYARICWGRKKQAARHKYELGLCFLAKEDSKKARAISLSDNFYWDIFKRSGSLRAYLHYRGKED